MFGDIFRKKKVIYKQMPFYLLKDKKYILENHRKKLLFLLQDRTGTRKYNDIFNLSFQFLIDNPKGYDGASGDNEFHSITQDGVEYRYDIPSIIHDVASVCGYDRDIERMTKANDLFKEMNKAMRVSSLHRAKRNLVGLNITNKIRLWSRQKKNIFYSQTDVTIKFEKLINKLIK